MITLYIHIRSMNIHYISTMNVESDGDILLAKRAGFCSLYPPPHNVNVCYVAKRIYFGCMFTGSVR